MSLGDLADDEEPEPPGGRGAAVGDRSAAWRTPVGLIVVGSGGEAQAFGCAAGPC